MEMRFDDDDIRAILTPKCEATPSPDFSQKVMAEIVSTASRHVRILGWCIPRHAASVAAISFAAICAVGAIAVISHETNVGEETTVSVGDSLPAPQQHQLPPLPLKYADAALATILDDVAARYDCTVLYADSTKRDIRLHLTISQDATLAEAVDIINRFDDITVTLSDNTITVK